MHARLLAPLIIRHPRAHLYSCVSPYHKCVPFISLCCPVPVVHRISTTSIEWAETICIHSHLPFLCQIPNTRLWPPERKDRERKEGESSGPMFFCPPSSVFLLSYFFFPGRLLGLDKKTASEQSTQKTTIDTKKKQWTPSKTIVTGSTRF